MTLIFELDLGSVKVNEHSHYLGHSSVQKLLAGHIRMMHAKPIALFGPLKWFVINPFQPMCCNVISTTNNTMNGTVELDWWSVAFGTGRW